MIGEKVSHYKIIEKLGGGGMGIIYKAQDLKLDRFVALKFLPPAFSMNEESKHNIINEAKIAATLEHPNICNIHEVGETEDEQIFIAMAYYEGDTLKKKIQNKSLDKNDIESILLQIAKGLEAAHGSGIVHRDIKPENIFITKQNEVKILDFGVAKIAGDFSVMDAEKVKGTIAYMSPEQISGKQIDLRSDIWSFGVLLYELITGEKPFSSEYDQSALYSIMNEDPDFSEFSQLLYLKDIVQKCLRKKKEDRFQSLKEIILLLDKKIVISRANKFQRRIVSTIMSIVLGAVFIIIVLNFIPQFQRLLNPSKINKSCLAVLPFSNKLGPAESNNTELLWQALIVRNLTNYEEFTIVDPLSLNGLIENASGLSNISSSLDLNDVLGDISVDYYLKSNIQLADNKNLIQAFLVKTSNKEILFSENLFFYHEDELQQLAMEISNKILDYFHIQSLLSGNDKDVYPFTQGTNNISALKSFLIASEHNYRVEKIEEEKYLKESISLDSTFISPRIWLIPTLYYRGELAEAKNQLAILKSLEQHANRFEQSLIEWADAFLDDNVENQRRFLKMALDYSPKNNIILYNLAYLYYCQQNYKEALKYLQQIIDMKWNFSGAYYLMGFCLLKLDDYLNTISILENSLSVKPVIDEIYLLLSISHLELENLELSEFYDSLYFHNTQIKGIPIITSLENSALISLEFDQIKYALINYQKILKIDPNNFLLREKLGDLFISNSDTNSAINEYLLALKTNTESLKLNYKLGEIFVRRKDTQNAIKFFEAVIQYDSNNTYENIEKRLNQLK